jgi:hypothetical protein
MDSVPKFLGGGKADLLNGYSVEYAYIQDTSSKGHTN